MFNCIEKLLFTIGIGFLVSKKYGENTFYI